MTTQYNVAVKVLDKSKEYLVQHALKNYRVFTDRSGNLDGTCFSREVLPYAGEFVVVKTIKKEAAETAEDVLKTIEGLLGLPTTESEWEKDGEIIKKLQEIPA